MQNKGHCFKSIYNEPQEKPNSTKDNSKFTTFDSFQTRLDIFL